MRILRCEYILCLCTIARWLHVAHEAVVAHAERQLDEARR